VLVAACSVNLDELRAPTAVARDAAIEAPVGTSAVEVGPAKPDSDGGSGGLDAAVAPPDRPGTEGLVMPDDGNDLPIQDPASDAASTDVLPDSIDLPLAPEDGSDSAGGSVSEAGRWGSSDGNEGNLVDAVSDGTGIDGGAGGVGGADGADTSRTGEVGTGGATSGLAAGQLAYYPCDQTSGSTLFDASGNGRNASLLTETGGSGGSSFNAGKAGNALSLVKGNKGYASIPQAVLAGATEMTIATWVYLNVSVDWQRLWDFSSDTNVYMFLTPRNGATQKLRFAMTVNGYFNEQVVDGAAELPANTWKHTAVVWGSGGVLLYIDGQLVASATGFSQLPSELTNTSKNYIGKSQYSSDPYLDGNVDDFRVYNRALSAAEIKTLFAYPGS